MWPDYDLDNPSTWEPMEAPSVDRSWTEALTKLGGLNPFGRPVLEMRWGATYRDPMSEDNGLKYFLSWGEGKLKRFAFTDPVTGMDMLVDKLDDVPDSIIAIPHYSAVELGERRFIVEQWRSAEFLARSGRYQEHTLHDPDKTYQFFFCKACDALLIVSDDGPNPCGKCGSCRSYLREARFEGDGKLLRAFPDDGAYDFFLRLENAEGGPMEPDGNALAWIERLWHEQKSKSTREKLSDMLAETADQEALNRAATSPANPFQSPAIKGW